MKRGRRHDEADGKCDEHDGDEVNLPLPRDNDELKAKECLNAWQDGPAFLEEQLETVRELEGFFCAVLFGHAGRLRRTQIYFEIMPTAASHVSTSCGHRVMGNSVGRSPNACPPFTNTCISAGTPAFLSAA